MTATDIVRDAIVNTPTYHAGRLFAELAEHSPVRCDGFLRNLTPELVQRTLLNAQWEPCDCDGLNPHERTYLARGILGVAADGRRTAHVTVLVIRGVDGVNFVAWLWPGDPVDEVELRAA